MPARGQRKPKTIIGDPTDPRGMARLSADYLEWMLVQNYSERTVEGREKYLRRFIVWCEERGIIRPTEITKPILERYSRWLFHYRKEDGHPLAFGSRFAILLAVRMFFRWLGRNNHILSNPASELEMPRREKRLPRAVLSIQEAETVINLPDAKEPLGIRDRAILETFYSTGMRRMELVNLHLSAVDAERGTVIVRQGKGKKDRMLPIGERALIWIEKYLTEVRPALVVEPDDATLFLTKDGTPLIPDHLSNTVKRYVDAAELGKTGACHLFRHTMATLMLEGGADIRYIQQMLGHSRLETTDVYTHVSIRTLKAVHAATHPARLTRAAGAQPPTTTSEPPPSPAVLLAALDREADEEAAALHPP